MPRNRKAKMRGNARRTGSFRSQGTKPQGGNQTFPNSQAPNLRNVVGQQEGGGNYFQGKMSPNPSSSGDGNVDSTMYDGNLYSHGNEGVDDTIPANDPSTNIPEGSSYNRKFSRCVMDSIRGGESYLNAKKKCNG